MGKGGSTQEEIETERRERYCIWTVKGFTGAARCCYTISGSSKQIFIICRLCVCVRTHANMHTQMAILPETRKRTMEKDDNEIRVT